jgi:hypothetical protein
MTYGDWAEQEDCHVNLDLANADGASMKVWNRVGDTPTNLQIKMEIHFPKWDFETACPIVNNFEERMKWDQRWVEPELLEKFEDGKVLAIYTKTPKPPVPVVWQRDATVKAFRIDDYEGDKSLILVTSVPNDTKPPQEGMLSSYQRGTAHLFATLIRRHPDGAGVVLDEIRNIDLNGNIPEMAVYQMSRWAP